MNLVALDADYTPAPAKNGIKKAVVVRGVITMIAFPGAYTLKILFYQCKSACTVSSSSGLITPVP
jgi:hypothetical protein